MLAGNRDAIGFELTPLTASWDRRYVPERDGWGALALYVGGVNIARHIASGSDTVDETLRVPLLPIVNWVAQSWTALTFEERPPYFSSDLSAHETLDRWMAVAPPPGLSEDDWLDLRQQWWSRHFLSASSDDTHLPSVAFVRQDDFLEVSWRTPRPIGARPPRFLEQSGLARVPWAEATSAFRQLVVITSGWTNDEDVLALYPWIGHNDQPLVLGGVIESLTLFTGRTSDELMHIAQAGSVGDLTQWLGLGDHPTDPSASPVSQILRDLSSPVQQSMAGLLARLRDETAEHADGAWKGLRAVAADAMSAGPTPEEAGQLAATAIRAAVGLDGQPIDKSTQLLRDLDITVERSTIGSATDRMITAARTDGKATVAILNHPRSRTRWGRRFEEARGLGHILMNAARGTAIGASSGPQAQALRRRRSGAFAAEFLLPYSALTERLHGSLDGAALNEVFDTLMSDFGVGARTAANQLFNHGLLASPGTRDELIDLFGR